MTSFLRSCCRYGDILTGACALVLLVSCGGGGSSAGGGSGGGSSSGGSNSFLFTEISTIGTNVSGDLAYLEAGANATFSVNVSCSVSCDGVQVLFFRSADSDISPQDEGIDNVTLNGTLGRTRILPFPFTAPEQPMSYYYGVCIGGICSAALKVLVPKAKVIGVDVITTDGTLAAGTAANFAVDVSCLASCADVDVRYFRSADGDISPQDEGIGNVSLSASPGEQALPPFPFTAPDDPGTYYYGVCIEDRIEDFIICSAGEEVPVWRARVTDVRADAALVMSNGALTLTATVLCEGPVACSAIVVSYYRVVGDGMVVSLGNSPMRTFDMGRSEDQDINAISAGDEDADYYACVGSFGSDLCSPAPFEVLIDVDDDGDGFLGSIDVDDDGDGLIEIWTAEELNNVRYQLNGSGYRTGANETTNTMGCPITECIGYELAADIDLASYGQSYAAGSGWQPIGNESVPFAAIFSGNDFTINNLIINRSGENNVGLFGRVSAAVKLQDVRLEEVNVSGNTNVGGLVGNGNASTITSSSVTGMVSGITRVGGLVGDGEGAMINVSSMAGTVRGFSNAIGGLVGRGTDTNITFSYAMGTVQGRNFAFDVGGLVGDGGGATITASYSMAMVRSEGGVIGGLVGDGDDMTIIASYSQGTVSGGGNVGGFVGYGDDMTIIASYSQGTVSGAIRVGGLTGGGNGVEITASYAAGGVSGNTEVGGFMGEVPSILPTITASYWDSVLFNEMGNTLGTPQTTEQLQMGAGTIYATWTDKCPNDESLNIWDFGSATQYPALNCPPGGLADQR